jgi:hypothetical protein
MDSEGGWQCRRGRGRRAEESNASPGLRAGQDLDSTSHQLGARRHPSYTEMAWGKFGCIESPAMVLNLQNETAGQIIP